MVGVGVLVGLRVGEGPRVRVGGGGDVLVAATVGTGVSLGGGTVVASTVPEVVSGGVMDGISASVGVFVGARVGRGACVGVATSVLPGRAKVEGGAWVGVGGKVGRTNGTTVVTTSGLAKSCGRMNKLTAPNP